jgi:hypothetical protein
MKSSILVLSTLILAACRGEAPDPVVPEINPAATSEVSAAPAASAPAGAAVDCTATDKDSEKKDCK